MSSLPGNPSKTPIWRNVRYISWFFQLLALGFVVLLLSWLYQNYQTNISQSMVQTDLKFLDNPASFSIPGSDFDQSQPVRTALVVGLMNTLKVAVLGVIFATILGTLIGIARLSKNYLLRKLSAAYVELIRNLPLLLLLTFMNLAVILQTFPRIEDAWVPLDSFVISNRGIAIPWFIGSSSVLLALFAGTLVLGVAVALILKNMSEARGKSIHWGLIGFLAFALTISIGWFTLGFNIELPAVDGRGTVGGLRLDPSFFAILVALVIYTSSHIAEIVRGSIMSVSKGQGEAADAIALKPGQKMRIIILPQAFRVAMPALGNQYLNLIKNSSLGATISYFEITQISQITVGNGSPAVPAFTITLLVYLAISLVVSLIVNFVNRRLALVER